MLLKMKTLIKLIPLAIFMGFNFCVFSQTKVETLLSDFAANGAVSVDEEGNVYVSEYGVYTINGGNGKRLFKISPNGQVLDSLNNLSGPMGTKKDSKGNLYINNDNNTKRGVVLKVTPDGKRVAFAEISGWPSSMTIDSQDNLYITNYNTGKINKIDKNGNVSIFSEDERLLGGVGIDFDSKGNLVVSNFYTAKIFSISKDGKISQVAQLEDIVVQGWGIGYIAVLDDFIYATGIAVSKIFKISLDGKVELFAGNGKAASVDGDLLTSSLSNPNGIAADKKNKILYISEYGPKGGIRKIRLD